MSSEADKDVYRASVEPQDNVNLFEAKKWTYVTDASNGQFSGQIQWNLQNLGNQNQWTDLSQAVLTFPVKLLLKNGGVSPVASTITVNAATIKNGFHQFVDSLQIVLGNTTLQSSMIYENINTSYKILTEMTEADFNKLAPSLGLGLDDVEPEADAVMSLTGNLDNAGLTTSKTGFNLSSEIHNSGIKKRLNMFNNSVVSTTFGRSILDGNQHVLGKSQVQVDNADKNINVEVFCLYALGTIRLRDVSDVIAKLPLIKNISGFVYLNYNSSETTLTGSASNVLLTMTSSAKYGRTCPANIINHATAGLNFSTSGSLVFTADISATTGTLNTAKPIQSNAIFHVPYYQATPEIDRALTMTKTIKYNERFVTEFSIGASESVNTILSAGITNPKRVILYPYFTGQDSASQNTGFLTNPLLSPFDGLGSTTSPFASLKNLQFNVGNVPIFQSPINMDWETFQSEVAQEPEKGLLDQRKWEQLYKYYTADIGRRMNSEDGSNKSIQVSCTNATLCPMKVIAMIWHEKEVKINTATCEISQTM